jgi:ADP-heptose:LPS heptosyltransferase
MNDEVKNNARALINKNLDASRRVVGFHCGSSADYKEKRWSVDKFISLITMIISAYNDIGIMIFFGPDESDIYEIMSNSFSTNRRVYLVNENHITMLCGYLETLSLFVTNDSGLMHLASVMGIPIISIWGPTDPVKNRPWEKNVEIVRLGLDCSPCYKIGLLNTCTNRICLENISTEMVFNVIAKKL